MQQTENERAVVVIYLACAELELQTSLAAIFNLIPASRRPCKQGKLRSWERVRCLCRSLNCSASLIQKDICMGFICLTYIFLGQPNLRRVRITCRLFASEGVCARRSKYIATPSIVGTRRGQLPIRSGKLLQRKSRSQKKEESLKIKYWRGKLNLAFLSNLYVLVNVRQKRRHQKVEY